MDAVMRSVEIATEPLGLHFSKNKVTVSTVGLVPEIRRFCRSERHAQLAVSLHAPNDALRNELVPVNRRYPLGDLIPCLSCVPHSPGRCFATFLQSFADYLDLSLLCSGASAELSS